MRSLGVDLAWHAGTGSRAANESGVAALGQGGQILAAGWAVGVDEVARWVEEHSGPDALVFIDAPLVVDNANGQRLCEKQVGQRYGRWKVSANSTNLASRGRTGILLRERLEAAGWCYDPGDSGPPTSGSVISECYPYTTLVGVPALRYDDERPLYKRKPRPLPTADWRPLRARACDDLVARLTALGAEDPPLQLDSHAVTRGLLSEPSPCNDRAYKHREDLIDAVLCAWTAALWLRHGLHASQVLGPPLPPADQAAPTIIAPARDSQRVARQAEHPAT